MKERTFLYDDGDNNFIIWSTNDDVAEIIAVYDDRVFYYLPNKILDIVLFTQLMEKMNISEDGRNGIRNTIMEFYDEWKAANKYKPTCKTYTWTISGPVNITCEDD